MSKLNAMLIGMLFFSVTAFSQTITVSGTIKDSSEKKTVKNAVVALLTVKDSILYKFARTNADGSFTLNNVKAGNYILMITHPYYADLIDDIVVKDANTQLGSLSVTNKSKLLQEVIIKSGSPIRIKGDTTIYTADSFKVSANANVEELLKKLPGIQVDKGGKITAMGQTVEKVLVDGEEFFGDDPGMAVKNLRADAVKEVQVFDKKSEQAEFTGIDDGKTQKTINLKLKDDRKKGYFGKIDAAGGPLKNMDPRYNANLLYGSFLGKRKISGFLLNSNTGQNGLNWQDEQKYGGGSDNMSMSMDEDGGTMMIWNNTGGGDEEPYVNTENGFIKTTNAGLQYSNKWNDKQTLNFSPKFTNQNYSNIQNTFTQTQINGTALNTNISTNTNVNRYNFKNNASLELKLDSNNTIKFTAKANFYHTESKEETNSATTGSTGTLKNTSHINALNNLDKNALYGTFLWKHKFAKNRRTLSLSAEWNQLNTNANDTLRSLNNDVFNNIIQNVDQQKIIDKTTNTLSSRLIYTEPINKKYALEFNYELLVNSGNNNQTTLSYNPASFKYDTGVDSLSNYFKQSIIVNKPGAKLSYSFKKLKFNFGSSFGITNYNLLNRTSNIAYPRNYINIFPTASVNFSTKANQSFRFNYNGNTVQPTLFQLQPLINNNNYFNQTIGNPNLKPAFNHTFSFSHFGNNFIKELYNYQDLYCTVSSNSITNNIITDTATGKTTSQPFNTNGNVQLNFNNGMGFKLKKLNVRGYVGPNIYYNRFANIINSKTSFSETTGAGMYFNFNKSKDKKYELAFYGNYNYNWNTSAQFSGTNKYASAKLDLEGTVYYKKVWSLWSDFMYYYRQKTIQFNSDLSNYLWNVKLQRTFKKDEFTAYISVNDVLNQNIGVDRNFYGNTTTQITNERLKRYGMIGFTWNFKNKTATK